MDDLIKDFISETSESLLNLDNELVDLESNPDNIDLVNKIFRVMHTIKGTCGFLGLNKLASVAHMTENILDKMRSKKISADSKNISVLLESIDTIKDIVNHITNNDGAEPQVEYGWLIDKINAVLNVQEPVKQEPQINVDLDKLFENKAISQQPETKIEIEKVIPKPTENQTKQVTSTIEDEATQAIRVKLETLDNLMQVVSELVLTRNQLLQIDRIIHNNELSEALQNLNFITSSIQEIVMSTRMQPISNAWMKVPRMIRDLSKDLNKKIKLEMVGKETELDRQLIELIKDPLTHMIRNSADHGLESEEIRIASGKTAEGTITLKAYHLSGNIIIEVSDDGAGIDIKGIKNKAIERGLSTENELNQMTEQQIIQFIFKGGFSTSDKITEISGRGVGMDVVKTNIESIRGSVEVRTVAGQGSTFVLKIPLTLAIMPILVVETQNQKFGIPQANILEMLRVDGDTAYKLEEMNDHLILRLRDNLVPLVKLSEILKLANSQDFLEEYYIVICEVRGKSFGIIVDNIFDTEEIVLKPLSKMLESLNIYAGTTLLGNGDIVLILAPNGIAQNIELLNSEGSNLKKQETKYIEEKTSFLVLKCGDFLKAVPIELVSRLEEIDVNKIENLKENKVIQYMNSLMYIDKLDPNYTIPTKGKQQIVVFMDNEHILGLVVEKIVDIVSTNISDNLSFDQSNQSTLVINDKAMDVININDFFEKFSFNFHGHATEGNSNYKILLIEESPFFRKLLNSQLKMEGFAVYAARTLEDATKLIDVNGINFNLLIVDVHLVELLRKNPKLQCIELIGLSTHNGKDEINSDIDNIVMKSDNQEFIRLVYLLFDSFSKENKNA